MKNYVLVITGWETNASGHKLTNEEVDIIETYKEENGVDNLSDVNYELEETLENYQPFDTNMWVIDKPAVNDILHFLLFESDNMEKPILEFGYNDLGDHSNYEEDFESKILNGHPIKDKEENILLWIEENKGWICDFAFESEEEPKPSDFTVKEGFIETPDGDWDFIDEVYLKGEKLDMNYNHQSTDGKGLTVVLWTLNDVRSWDEE
jgi:hypothetical protein